MLVTLNKGYRFKIKPTQEQKEFFVSNLVNQLMIMDLVCSDNFANIN